ncbi:MAG: ABC transporter substrate-binding protein [Methanoregulaceae archaeon]|jgi:branched-chain amino acid transport system substrate-binding protein|nr:ABC transporter substrate-binding protein [Methanoregulaceae archaeon]MCU0628447.1 ABC transporter substrate-binding protein [Methanoregulaceae archaeon]
MKRTLGFILIVFIGLVLIAGCTEEQASGEELKIGVVASMTGPASTTGKDIWQSAQLAADEINADGGVYIADLNKKIPIRLVQGDDESTREGGQKAVSRMITQDNVDILVGGFSSAVVSAHQSIVAANKVPYIITGASTPTITRNPDVDTSYMFHHAPTCDDSGSQITLFINDTIRPAINAKFGFSADRPLKLAILYQDSPYGKGHQTAIKDTIAKNNLNIDVVAEEAFKMGESDYRTVLTSIKNADPDVVYVAAFLNEQIPIETQAMRDVGLNKIFTAVEPNDDPDFYKGVGKYGEYSIVQSRFSPYTVPKGPTEAAYNKFVTDFDKKFGGFPGMMGVATYEGVYIAAQAVEDAGTLNKTQVKDSIAQIQMPQMVETMKGQTINFSPDYRESKFDLTMEQLFWDGSVNETRPKIIWPASLKETDFILPDWFEPGKT